MQRELGCYEAGIGTGFGIHAAVKLFVAGERVGHFYKPTVIDQHPNLSYLLLAADATKEFYQTPFPNLPPTAITLSNIADKAEEFDRGE